MPRCNIRRVVSLRAQLSLVLMVECVGHGTSNIEIRVVLSHRANSVAHVRVPIGAVTSPKREARHIDCARCEFMCLSMYHVSWTASRPRPMNHNPYPFLLKPFI